MKTAGGRFDPAEPAVYFIASGSDGTEIAEGHSWNLIAVNDLWNDAQVEELERRLEAGNRILLDSGIFWLTNRHKREHLGMDMNEALSLSPEEIDGFDELWERYVYLATTYGDRLWGYIELDQGGAVNKRRTRARLHDIGLSPIPVYHPINDGWDYFDELCRVFDRICVGNVVQASPSDRKRLLATVWERKRDYPHVWIHLLGYTPNALSTVYPQNSYDSFSMMGALKWGADQIHSRSMGHTFSEFGKAFSYKRDHVREKREEPGGYADARRFIAAESGMLQFVMRFQSEEIDRVFEQDRWPARVDGEPKPVPGVST